MINGYIYEGKRTIRTGQKINVRPNTNKRVPNASVLIRTHVIVISSVRRSDIGTDDVPKGTIQSLRPYMGGGGWVL